MQRHDGRVESGVVDEAKVDEKRFFCESEKKMVSLHRFYSATKRRCMFDFETSVSGIEYKVRQLADEVARLRELVVERDNTCAELREALDEKNKLINKLKEENSLIKLGNRLAEKNDSAELKVRINQMIRTIDKSLEILKSADLAQK